MSGVRAGVGVVLVTAAGPVRGTGITTAHDALVVVRMIGTETGIGLDPVPDLVAGRVDIVHPAGPRADAIHGAH